MASEQGIVFNIQKFSIHDGPGIRTLVFLKGCPLRCLWCCNPESQSPLPEPGYKPEKCFGCARCVARCAKGALSIRKGEPLRIRRDICKGDCPECAKTCPDKALTIYGKPMSVADVLAVVEQDALFYSRSGGGLSISGGEPLAQPAFLEALLREAGRRRIHRAMETSAFAPADLWLRLLALVDYLLVDLKHMDEDRHRELTGVSNRPIIANIAAARQRYPGLPMRIRTPLVPGHTAEEANVTAIGRFARELGAEYEVLPYHAMGRSKYASLGRDYPPGDLRLEDEQFKFLEDRARTACAPFVPMEAK